MQLISRAQLAPFFAAANIVAALMMSPTCGAGRQPDLAGAVGRCGHVVNLGAMQLARTQSINCVGRSGRRVPMWLMVGEVGSARRRLARSAALLFPSLIRRPK